jgi:cytochrome c oxidase assembly factor CtaG
VLGAISYLFSACLCCSILGAFLTFGPAGLYTHHTKHIVVDSKSDQQLGGLLMWVPGCFIYLSAILVSLRRWYSAETTA